MHETKKSLFEQQGEFFRVMGSPSLEKGATLERCCALGEALILEEVVDETLPALLKYRRNPSFENLVELADGLVDSVYVLLHTANSLGIPFDLVWDEVQKSNMAKVWEDGTAHKREDGKILKPPGWKPPDIFGVLMEYETRKKMGDKYMEKGVVS